MEKENNRPSQHKGDLGQNEISIVESNKVFPLKGDLSTKQEENEFFISENNFELSDILDRHVRRMNLAYAQATGMINPSNIQNPNSTQASINQINNLEPCTKKCPLCKKQCIYSNNLVPHLGTHKCTGNHSW